MTIRQVLNIVEIRTKIISASTYLVATLYVWWRGVEIRPGIAVLLGIAVLFVDMGTTGFNTFFDYMRGVDSEEFTRESDKVLVHESVGPGWAFIVAFTFFLIAGAAGIAVALLTTWWIIPIGAASFLIGFLYTAGPLPISRTPLGELFAGGALGTVLFLVIVAVHAGGISRADFLASLPGGLMIGSVLTVNNTCDIEGDRNAGRLTLSVLVGRRMAQALVYLLGTGVFVLIGVLAATGGAGWPFVRSVSVTVVSGEALLAAVPGAGVVLAPIGFIAALAVYVGMHRRGFSHATKPRQMRAIIRVMIIYTATYGASFIVGTLIRNLGG